MREKYKIPIPAKLYGLDYFKTRHNIMEMLSNSLRFIPVNIVIPKDTEIAVLFQKFSLNGIDFIIFLL